ncbi:hypothetical protein BSKO_08257 [Bryopsis sp. KO-2023]|nr:hypothetical protein BSKO_08257 [Bryopsis sp. KO-2023]
MLAWVAVVLTVGVVTLRRGVSRKEIDATQGSSAKDVASRGAPPSTNSQMLQRLYANHRWIVAILLLGVLFLTLSKPAAKFAGFGGDACTALSSADRASLLAERSGVDHPITTDHEEAQVHFNQGLLFRWAFNDVEASKSFKLASKLDPACSMCWWGQGYAISPHLNFLFHDADAAYPVASKNTLNEVRERVQRGLEIAEQNLAKSPDNATLKKREIAYMQATLLKCTPKEMTVLDQFASELKFASKMLELWLEEPSDVDAGVLAAESIMILFSWRFFYPSGEKGSNSDVSGSTWQGMLNEAASLSGLAPTSVATTLNDVGVEIGDFFSKMPLDASVHASRVDGDRMRPGARVAEEILLRVLHANPSHAYAVHLHIHLTEGGPPGESSGAPIKTVPFADNLVKAAPHAGHLLHMPSHTYLRVGQYEKAVECNIRSYEQNVKIGKSCMSGYVPEHDLDVLVYAASSAGMLAVAEKYAKAMQTLPEDVAGPYVSSGHEYVSLILVWVRYAHWEKILNARGPAEDSRGSSSKGGPEFSKLIWKFARYLAISQTSRKSRRELLVDAGEGLVELNELLGQVPEPVMSKPGDGVGIYSQPYIDLGKLYVLEASARSAVSKGDMAAARGHLEDAVKLQDSMGYMEPPRVHQPVRQCLGWLLFMTGEPTLAEKAFLEDLGEVPLNPWSLFGLASLHRDESVSTEYQRLYEQAWKGGEEGLSSSCPMIF